MTFGDMMNTIPDQPLDPDMTPSAPPPSAPPPPKGILQTSFDGKGGEWGSDDTMQRLRGAFGEGYQATAQPSQTRAGIRSIFTPEQQSEWRTPGEGGWTTGRSVWGPALNAVGDIIGTGAADVAGAGNAVATLGNETLKSMGAPDNLIRDINLGVSAAPFTPELRMTPKLIPRESANIQREMATPPPPSLSELLQRQRAAPSADPVTDAAISLLRRTQQPTSMPQPPVPFTNAAPPAPTPSGGLLGIPPSPGAPLPGPAAPAMTADEMLARSQGYYSPADKQAAQGALLHPQAGDSIRSILTDAIPTDPEKAALVGDTPLVQMGKAVQPYMGQPMSFDTAMSYDRQLTGRIQTALRAGDKTAASQLGDAQDALRAKMDTIGDSDTTGDPTALANLTPARQAYAQYVKQSQIEDMQYRASLLPDDKQDAYLRGQAKSMLSGNKTANWSDAERGQLEDALKSGNIGPLKSFGLSLVKPAAQAVGGTAGGTMFGAPGAFVGGQIGGEMGATWQAKLRAAMSKISLDKVNQAISQGVPPPPPTP